MKRYSLPLIAISSVLWAWRSNAEVRPHYGGTLNIAVRESCPASGPFGSLDCDNISRLIFETLIELDANGCPQPLLADSWQSEPGNQRWRILLRSGVSFHDGSAFDTGAAVASLRSANPGWKVFVVGESVTVETGVAEPNLPAELALQRNAIVRRSGDRLVGTGPFAIRAWDPGKHMSLTANDQYRSGRPFVDGIEVDFSKGEREQMLALDVNKTDLVDIAPEDIRRARTDGRMVFSSEPSELVALMFTTAPRSEDDVHLRNALALGLDRAPIGSVVFQGGGSPTAALLPEWLSGYAFAFGSGPNVQQARQERAQVKRTVPLTLAYDTNDPVARLISERVMLNARDAGVTVQLGGSSSPDLRLVRVRLLSFSPEVALTELARPLQLPNPSFSGDSVMALYTAEKELLQSHRVIPLLHLRSAAAARERVHDFAIFPDGSWRIANVWLLERP